MSVEFSYYNALNVDLRKYLTLLSKQDDTAKKRMFDSKESYLSMINLQDSIARIEYDKMLDNHILLQEYRLKKGDSTSSYYLTLKRILRQKFIPTSKYDSMFVKVAERNILVLDSISKSLGYVPGEKTIGIVDHQFDNYITKRNRHSAMFTPIIVHIIYHHGCGFWMMRKELRESVKRGELHPRYYAAMYDYSYCDLKDKSYNLSYTNLSILYEIKCTVPKKDKIYNVISINCPAESAKEFFIDKCREELSISSLEHDRKKKAYAKKHHLILFFGLLGSEI